MKPILQALIVAERIYEDKTGKKIIAGTFNQVFIHDNPSPPGSPSAPGQEAKHPAGAPGGEEPKQHGAAGQPQQQKPPGQQLPPSDPGSPWVYISLTDVHDNTDILLQMNNVSKNEVLFQTPIRIHSQDRLATIEIIYPLPPMRMFVKEEGTLSLDVLWRGEIVGSHRLLVRKVK